jgi:DNA polymerase IV
MPSVQARALCPDAVFLRGDMAKYRRVSAEIRAIFGTISPDVEPLSLDEAFIDVTASQSLLGPPLAIGRLLKERVRAATALAVSVGIGPGKMVAKIASDVGKPDGLVEVQADRVSAFLEPLPVGRLWGVGPVTETALARAGIATIGELARRSTADLAAAVGRRAAEHLRCLATGEDARFVEPDLAAKSYGEEGTFGRDTAADGVVRTAIIEHAEAVARRLRRDRVRGRVVVLKLKLAERLGPGRFRLLTRRTTLDEPSDDGKALADAALRLWADHRPRLPVRLVGVSAAGIVDDAPEQLGLFADGGRLRQAALNRALDAIVARFGTESIGRGVPAPREKGLTTRLKRGE